MGRPPLGETAMSSAERVRRHRQRHGKAGNETRNVMPGNGNTTAARNESNETISALQARVAELEADAARTPQAAGAKDWQLLHQMQKRAKAALRDARKDARDEVAKQVAALEAKIARFEAEPDVASAERIAALETQLKGARTQARKLQIQLERITLSKSGVLSKAELTTLRRALHPDAIHNEEALTKAAALFNSLVDAGRVVVGEETA